MSVTVEAMMETTRPQAVAPGLGRQLRPWVLAGLGLFVIAGGWFVGIAYLALLPGWFTLGAAIRDFLDLRQVRRAHRLAQRLLRRHELDFSGRSLVQSQLLRDGASWQLNAVFRDRRGHSFLYQARFKGQNLLQEGHDLIHEQEAGERLALMAAGQPSNLNEDSRDD